MVSEQRVVNAAVEAAESVVFSRCDRSDIEDIDIGITFKNGQLEVDIYLHVPEAADEEQVTTDAALAARSAVDELLTE